MNSELSRQTTQFEKWGLVIGRCLLASLFFLGGINKVSNYSATFSQMDAAALPMVGVLLPAVIALELGAGILIACAGSFHRFAAIALACFTLITNLVFHDFWNMQGDIRTLELSLFFKNISIAGGLIFVASVR